MTNNKVTIKDVYEIVDRVDTKLDKLGERVSALEIWRANILGKLAVVVGIIGLCSNLAIEYFKVNFLERR